MSLLVPQCHKNTIGGWNKMATWLSWGLLLLVFIIYDSALEACLAKRRIRSLSLYVSRYFWIHNFLFLVSKISSSTRSVFKLIFTCPLPDYCIRIRPAWCAAILVYCLVRGYINTIFLRHRICRPHAIAFACGFIFSTLESGLENTRIRWMRADGSPVQEKKVADSIILGYVWTGLNESSTLYHRLF